MIPEPPIPQSLWNTVPPEAQAALLALLDSLEKRIAELEARLNQNSTNSSQAPSSDPIGLQRKPPAPPSRRNEGLRTRIGDLRPLRKSASPLAVSPSRTVSCRPGSHH